MTSPSEEYLQPGTVLKGRYLIQQQLGHGGMGVVYLAHDLQLLSRPVVIKVLLESSYQDEWISRKFRQEMEALARLDHPGIVAVFDAGEIENGRPFLVMQYVEGVNLRNILTAGGLELARVANILQQTGAALKAAHE